MSVYPVDYDLIRHETQYQMPNHCLALKSLNQSSDFETNNNDKLFWKEIKEKFVKAKTL